jgi:hypothetical protein
MGQPTHIQKNWSNLRKFATIMQNIYGSSVFLCGSALLDFNSDPRDWDIRVIIEDSEFERRYGSVSKWNEPPTEDGLNRVRTRWAADCMKRSKKAWEVTGLHIDFQVQPESHVNEVYKTSPKLKII